MLEYPKPGLQSWIIFFFCITSREASKYCYSFWRNTLCTLAHSLLISMVRSRSEFDTHSADKESTQCHTVWKRPSRARLEPNLENYRPQTLLPLGSSIRASFWQWKTLCPRLPCTHSYYLTCSVPGPRPFPGGKRKQEELQQPGPLGLQTFPDPGWQSKPPDRFQPKQEEGSPAARKERLQSFSCERVGWWITCRNTFSCWETSWKALGAGDGGTPGRKTFCSPLAPVPSWTPIGRLHRYRQRPLRQDWAEAGGSDRSAPRDSAQHPGVAGMKMEVLGEFPVGPIARTLPRFHSRDMSLIPGLWTKILHATWPGQINK